jgi:C1A family cysteine protease
MDYKFGALQSPPDYRDYLYRAIFAAQPLPAKFSRRSEMGPVRNQGQFGTCVGFAAAAVKDNQESREAGQQVVTSPLYLYKRCKEQDGIPTQEGTYPRTVMAVLKNLGICPEETWPYDKMAWPSMPAVPSGADQQAAGYKIGAYARITTIDEVKQAIVKDGPVLGAVLVCQSFMDAVDGIIPIPGSGNEPDYIRGGHAICVTGYDDNMTAKGHTGYLEFRNSWGPEWGDGGYGYIPYEFFNRKTVDTGMQYWMESWSSVDIIVPKPAAKEGFLWIGKDYALIDGKEVRLDAAPYIVPEAGRTMVPLRFMAENFGYHVEWSESARRIRFWR